MIEELQEVQCRQLRKVKTPEGPSHWRDPTLLCVLTSEMLPGSHSEYWRKTPHGFGKGRGKVMLCKHLLDRGESEGIPEKHLLSASLTTRKSLTVNHNKLWKIPKEM